MIMFLGIFILLACEDVDKTKPEHWHGVTWKLVGFVDAEGNLEQVKPDDVRCYWIIFNQDGTYYGASSTNEIDGKYDFNAKALKIHILSYGGTKINELFDGKLYVENLKSIHSFSYTKEELKLYYDEGNNYLLFKAF